ncbi:MAG: ATP phosphoribosyltransferase regulatory subunit [Chloroflexota bacterium]|nr:ATP phosphoribosyltransferase regulatory subunit [Chloroflexota bacterium]
MERRAVERVRGTQDLAPDDAWHLDAVRRRFEETFVTFGYRRVDVPALEPAELHLRKSGLEIISKLYAFDDQGGRRLCLRPELTASVVRAYIGQPAPRFPVKVFSSGLVFRYERPSKGRHRQFTQSGVELFGAAGPLADAEIVFLAMDALDRLGLADYRVTIGHVGILGELLTKLGLTGRLRTQLLESVEETRRHGLAAVRSRLRELDPDLFEPPGQGELEHTLPAAATGDDQDPQDGVRASLTGLLAQMGAERLGRRSEAEIVERLLRKLRPQSQRDAIERALEFMERLGRIQGAPDEVLEAGRELLGAFGLDADPLHSLEQTVRLLAACGADFQRVRLDLGLSRGLQYYTGMVFEIDHAGLGAESQLCGGGRYDELFRALGSRQSVAALGFAFGVERVKLALEAERRLESPPAAADVFVIPDAPEHAGYAARVAAALRRAGRRADLDVTGRPLRASLTYADREGYAQVAVIGAAEASDERVRLRDMADGRERSVPLGELTRNGPGAGGRVPPSEAQPTHVSAPRGTERPVGDGQASDPSEAGRGR